MRKAVLAAVLLAVPLFSAPVVNLTVKENAGVARVNENVTMGVPLPESGNYTNAALFTLRDSANNIIPCEIRKVCPWIKDSTKIRWLHLNFPYSIPANAARTLTLTSESAPYTLPSKLTVQDRTTYIEINTGVLRAYIKKTNFNLFDQVWINPAGTEQYGDSNKIVASHTGGLVHYRSDTSFASVNDAASAVVIERQGPGMVTIKATGRLKNAAGAGSLYFICRIYAFNNSPTLRVQATIENRDVATNTYQLLQGYQLEVPLNLNTARNAVVSKPGGFEQASLTAGQDLFCMTSRPAGSETSIGTVINGSVGGAVTATFNPKTLKPKDLGWAALGDGTKGCLVGMKYFWQMCPASAEAFADGRLVAGAMSKRSGQKALMFYAGAARTSETQWTFYTNSTADVLRSKGVETTNRLFAVAPNKWYNWQTLSFGHMLDSNLNYYSPTNRTRVQLWENTLSRLWKSTLTYDDSYSSYDSYGYLEWGDNPHWLYSTATYPALIFPWNLLWNSNYYGMDFMSFAEFYHTGDLRFLEWGMAHARHVQDVHQVHLDPANPNTGGGRYCPPLYHFAVDAVAPTSFTLDNPSHHKVEGMILDYYLTGNDYALQIALEGAAWFNRAGTSYAAPSELAQYVRRWAHQMFDIIAAYQHTLNPAYYTTICRNWDLMKNNIRTNVTLGQNFMVGLGFEAIEKMYWVLSPTYTVGGVTKPDSIAHYLKIWGDRAKTVAIGTSSANINGNTTLGYAFLSWLYGGDSTYQALAHQRAVSLTNPSPHHKQFAQQGRNFTMAMYYMAIGDSINRPWPIAVETPSRSLEVETPVISLFPEPSNPAATVTVRGVDLNKAARVALQVFSVNGKLVADLTPGLDRTKGTAVWNAGHLASGVYLVKLTADSRTLEHRMTLIK